jgi:mRNA-degrading endonuclease toxin of MazEF toxin-antitoxin module
MPRPGDVVIVRFPGAVVTKSRPAVVVSSPEYHHARPDCVLALVTSNVATATTEFDHVLVDWESAGLEQPSAVRMYFGIALSRSLDVVGTLSDRDFAAVKRCLAPVLAT